MKIGFLLEDATCSRALRRKDTPREIADEQRAPCRHPGAYHEDSLEDPSASRQAGRRHDAFRTSGASTPNTLRTCRAPPGRGEFRGRPTERGREDAPHLRAEDIGFHRDARGVADAWTTPQVLSLLPQDACARVSRTPNSPRIHCQHLADATCEEGIRTSLRTAASLDISLVAARLQDARPLADGRIDLLRMSSTPRTCRARPGRTEPRGRHMQSEDKRTPCAFATKSGRTGTLMNLTPQDA